MKRLIAGPWAGELGWELMSWQGLVRKLSRGYDETVVCSDDGHQALYADFAASYIPHKLLGQRDCYHFMPANPTAFFALMDSLTKMGGDCVRPTIQALMAQQEFIRYGNAARCPENRRYDVLVHVRQKRDVKVQRSWPEDHAVGVVKTLREAGLRVGAIGAPGTPMAGAANAIGFPLGELMDVLAAAKLVVGPCSGPIHLAALCGTPAVAWTDTRKWTSLKFTNRERLERYWNPLGTPVRVVDKYGWLPPADIVVGQALSFLAEMKR